MYIFFCNSFCNQLQIIIINVLYFITIKLDFLTMVGPAEKALKALTDHLCLFQLNGPVAQAGIHDTEILGSGQLWWGCHPVGSAGSVVFQLLC